MFFPNYSASFGYRPLRFFVTSVHIEYYVHMTMTCALMLGNPLLTFSVMYIKITCIVNFNGF